MNNCTHRKTINVREVVTRWVDYAQDWEEVEVEKTETISAFEDIDTHRLKCSICGKIEYYSQSARDHYEKGIPSPWVR
jgi:hypothetical protein